MRADFKLQCDSLTDRRYFYFLDSFIVINFLSPNYFTAGKFYSEPNYIFLRYMRF